MMHGQENIKLNCVYHLRQTLTVKIRLLDCVAEFGEALNVWMQDCPLPCSEQEHQYSGYLLSSKASVTYSEFKVGGLCKYVEHRHTLNFYGHCLLSG
jgi:hypothetical protein